jgi:hypothetical protein
VVLVVVKALQIAMVHQDRVVLLNIVFLMKTIHTLVVFHPIEAAQVVEERVHTLIGILLLQTTLAVPPVLLVKRVY